MRASSGISDGFAFAIGLEALFRGAGSGTLDFDVKCRCWRRELIPQDRRLSYIKPFRPSVVATMYHVYLHLGGLMRLEALRRFHQPPSGIGRFGLRTAQITLYRGG